MTKPISHSWTKIQDYQTCPFMYKARHVDRKVAEVNPLMIVGRVTHNGINLYNKHCLRKGIEQDFEKWKDCAYLALEQENLNAEHYPEVLEMIKGYAESHMIALESAVGAEEAMAITRDFKETEWDADDVWFRVIVDFLQIAGDVAKITDYKAGWLMEAPRLQLEIYAWIVKKIYPQVTMFDVELEFVRHEYKEHFTIEEDAIEDIEKKILSKTNKIEKDDKFEPTINIACSYCGCWRWCPALKADDLTNKIVVPETPEDATKLALQFEKYSKLKDEMQKVLKIYCDNKGDLVAGGRQYGFNVSQKWEIPDVAELITKADEAGVDVFSALTVHNTRLRQIMENEAIKKIVMELGQKKVSVSFTAKKYKPQDDLTPPGMEGEPIHPEAEEAL